MFALYGFVLLIIFSKSSDSKLIRHTFVIEYISGYPDGVFKEKIFGINGQFPGPVIEGRTGDTLQVDVINRIQDKQNTSIHWHGIHQKDTPWEDGVASITQCPIGYSESQRYSFQLKQAGTFWYHSHVHSQYSEGLWGVLIVHNDPEEYSYDGSIIITLNDWYHHTAQQNEEWRLTPHTSRNVYPYPDSGLINGVGRYMCGYAIHPCNISYQMRPVFKVQREKTYRVHLINTAAVVQFNFSIDGHPLQVIETDSIDVKKGMHYEIASIAPGQRYSFLITTKAENETRFLIRADIRTDRLFLTIATTMNNNMYPELLLGDVTAVLEYSEENSVELEPFSYLDEVPKIDRDLIPVDEMELAPLDGVSAPVKYDVELVLMAEFHMHKDDVYRGSFNFTPFILPNGIKPLLMTVADGEKISDDLLHFEVNYMDVVNLVVNTNFVGSHLFHLHGYDFWVLGQGSHNDGNYDAIRHNATLKLTGPKRDTVLMEARSWVMIRFIADNPGVWYFHCHLDFHKMLGMSSVFVVGRKEIENMKFNEEAHNVCKQNMYRIDDRSDTKLAEIPTKSPLNSIPSSSANVITASVLFLCISFLNINLI